MHIPISDILYSQGFGTRRVCAGLVQLGHVRVGGETITDASRTFDTQELKFEVDGAAWAFQERGYAMLYKPAGTECSRKPSAHPSIYTLLPAPLRSRPNKGAEQGLQAVGRLDQDTTGLLLLSDDGTFIHRMTSPRHHVPKVYEVGLKHAADERMVRKLVEGVQLDDERLPTRAAACEITGERSLRLTLTEGKYHQVKRMVAAAGNRVETLHRSRIGSLELPSDMPPGAWRWLTSQEVGELLLR